MFRIFRIAYGAGFRAGICGHRYVECADGLKRPAPVLEACPYLGRWQFVQRWLWTEGWYAGLHQMLVKWLESRRVAQ